MRLPPAAPTACASARPACPAAVCSYLPANASNVVHVLLPRRWAYAVLALLDVEANACLVLAYRFTSLTR